MKFGIEQGTVYAKIDDVRQAHPELKTVKTLHAWERQRDKTEGGSSITFNILFRINTRRIVPVALIEHMRSDERLGVGTVYARIDGKPASESPLTYALDIRGVQDGQKLTWEEVSKLGKTIPYKPIYQRSDFW